MELRNIHCIPIDITEKVDESIREKIFFKSDLSEIDNNCIVWNQMKIEHFGTMLKNKALSFKKMSAYPKDAERKLSNYKKDVIESSDISKKEILKRLYSNIENITYVLCWYVGENLSITNFEKYSGGDGIAIGVSVEQLIKSIEENNKGLGVMQEELYYGLVGYLAEEHKEVVKKEEVVAPFFLKAKSHETDTEFRLIYINDSLWESNASGLSLRKEPAERVSICIGNIEQFIKYIAFRENEENRNLPYPLDMVLKNSKLQLEETTTMKMDGFIVCELKKMG